MQHESFCGDKATTWNPTDSIKIKVNCRDDAETKIPEIEYALLVSFELAEEVCAKLDIDVYEIISTKIRELVPIQTINPTI